MLDKNKLIIALFPFFIILLDLVFSLSSQLGDRSTLLCLFLAVWMVTWWIFEILPMGVTALLPLFYLPMLGIVSVKEVTPAYSNPVIFLFLGGFVIARALEKTQLDERIAMTILKKTGRSDRGIIIGFMIATGFLSMWISNTATTVMMVPIAMSVVHFLQTHLDSDARKQLPMFSVVLFLTIAYSANVGGIATPVGTPPNVVFMGYLSDLYSRSIDFYIWILATLPLVIVLYALMYLVLQKLYKHRVPLPNTFPQFIDKKIQSLGVISNQQRVTLVVFLLAALLWVFKDLIHYIIGQQFLNDTSVAILCGFLLFLIPAENKDWQPVLSLEDISKLPWDIVLLFGGGMALAGSLSDVGLIQQATLWLSQLDLGSHFALIVAVSASALLLTEVMSNVALCVVALPLIMKLGEAQGIDPVLIAMPAALCTSFAFSMPISTPPNAIVFGTHKVSVKQMLKAGAVLNILALALTCSLGYFMILWLVV